MREGRKQIIIGTIIIVGIFVAVMAGINGASFMHTFITASAASQVNIELRDEEIENLESNQPESKETRQYSYNIPESKNIMYLSLASNGEEAETKIILKNSESEEGEVTLSLIGGEGEWYTYSPFKIPGGGNYIVKLSQLANTPPDLDPGVAIISTEQQVAAIAEITNKNGIKTKLFSPYVAPKEKLFFEFTSDKDNQIKQDTAVVSNLDDNITDIQFTIRKTDGETETSKKVEIGPWETRVINIQEDIELPLSTKHYETLLVSSTTPNIIGALCLFDNFSGTWANIIIDRGVE